MSNIHKILYIYTYAHTKLSFAGLSCPFQRSTVFLFLRLPPYPHPIHRDFSVMVTSCALGSAIGFKPFQILSVPQN